MLSTAMSFLGLYRDPVVAKVTRPLRLAHRRSGRGRSAPVSLYLVVPPSDISRTKPLIRLILNQIGRRLTEDLNAKRPPPSAAADARRVSGAGTAGFLRIRTGLHGRLRHQELL